MNRIETTDQILLMAFRYALIRKTGAVNEVVRELKRNWDKLPQWMREQIRADIDRQKVLSTKAHYEDFDQLWETVAH